MNARMPELPNAACRLPQNRDRFARLNGSGGGHAREICNSCWDRPECLTWGLEHERNGMWGGHSVIGLRRLRQEFGIELHEILAGSRS